MKQMKTRWRNSDYRTYGLMPCVLMPRNSTLALQKARSMTFWHMVLVLALALSSYQGRLNQPQNVRTFHFIYGEICLIMSLGHATENSRVTLVTLSLIKGTSASQTC